LKFVGGDALSDSRFRPVSPRRIRRARRGQPRRRRMAVRLLRARLRDGRRGRRHAAYAFGVVDHRVAADCRYGSAVVGRAVQGALGWYMVQSGLVDDPRVSPFRLSAHLGLAFAILAGMLWTAMTLRRPQRAAPDAPAQRTTRRLAFFLAALVFAMVLSGAFVAGIRAGFAYNT